MSNFAAVLDANVLNSYPLTCVLLELAEARLCRPIWSTDIHNEWITAVLEKRPEIPRAALERRRDAMDEALPDACVGGYNRLIPALELPDPDDRHVFAAAIRAKAQVIVTFNERDFPAQVLANSTSARSIPIRSCDI
ncbi:MAG: PIN domain-containing protein [Pseudomonadota bacterium]|nr:PIN domain-containing protein [Pseudomonadota bacterium]